MTHIIAVCTVKTPDDGQRNRAKHVEYYSKNKFETLVHLVAFIIRIMKFHLSWTAYILSVGKELPAFRQLEYPYPHSQACGLLDRRNESTTNVLNFGK